MNKIATTTELQSELHRLLAYASEPRPSRMLLARDLQVLSMRVGAAGAESRKAAERAMKKADAAEEKASADRGTMNAQSAMNLCDAAVDQLSKAVKDGHDDLESKVKYYRKRAKFWASSVKEQDNENKKRGGRR